METLICRVVADQYNAACIQLRLILRLGEAVRVTPVAGGIAIPPAALAEGYRCWAFVTGGRG